MTGIFTWSGRGDGSVIPPSRSWFTASGWENDRITPSSVADFNQDGRTDISALYNYGNGHTAMFTWNGQLSGAFDSPVMRWQDLAGWETQRITPLGNADFNGDGNQDVAAFYKYGGGAVGIFTWNGLGNGNITPPARSWFTSNGWENTRILP